MKRLSIILLIVFCAMTSADAQRPYFNKFFNMGDYDNAGSIGVNLIQADSQIIVTGITNTKQFPGQIQFISGFNLKGELEWKKLIGMQGRNYYGFLKDGTIQLKGGNFIMGGYVEEFTDSADHIPYYEHAVLTKFTPEGDTLWHRVYRDSQSRERFYSLKELNNGGLLAAGIRSEGDTNITPRGVFYRENSILLKKLDADGNELWSRQFHKTYTYEVINDLRSLILGSNGEIILGCSNFFGGHDRSPFIFMVDSTGQKIKWDLKLGSENSDFHRLAITQSQSGGYLFAGSYTPYMGQNGPHVYPEDDHLYYGKFNDEVDTLWTKKYSIPGDTIGFINGYDISEMPNGDLMLLGEKGDSTAKALVVKTDSMGNVLWHRQYWVYDLYTVANKAYSMDVMNDGGVAFTGEMKSTYYYPPVVDTVGQYMWLVRTDSLGCVEPGCDTLDNPTGIQVIMPPGLQNESVRLYPNPASGTVHITYEEEVAKDALHIYDLSGRVVQELTVASDLSSTTVDISHLPNGMYMVEVLNNGKRLAVEKLVVE